MISLLAGMALLLGALVKTGGLWRPERARVVSDLTQHYCYYSLASDAKDNNRDLSLGEYKAFASPKSDAARSHIMGCGLGASLGLSPTLLFGPLSTISAVAVVRLGSGGLLTFAEKSDAAAGLLESKSKEVPWPEGDYFHDNERLVTLDEDDIADGYLADVRIRGGAGICRGKVSIKSVRKSDDHTLLIGNRCVLRTRITAGRVEISEGPGCEYERSIGCSFTGDYKSIKWYEQSAKPSQPVEASPTPDAATAPGVASTVEEFARAAALEAARVADGASSEADEAARIMKETARVDDQYFADLDAKIPDWEKVNDSREFVDWLKNRDEHSGETYYNLLASAHKQRNVERVIEVFRIYKPELVVDSTTASASPTATAAGSD
ncbi:hypothetical protein J2X06_001742 [Lysobacter niastensis]|uniref:Uncharacterized protein n=1 Tax=Lysobacter niastensis TaxID=380629 RepID=A0ABU1WAG6_9GAMM|nr:hypothetical protein [Lysobacter niastensis]MDR7134558.1 hypothetical protein [Lysobacter niastensis]